MLGKPSTLEELIPDRHLLAMLSESQRMPWFQLQGYASIGSTKTGSGPGGPLADLMYNLAMLPAINEIDSQLVAAGLIFNTPTSNSVFTDTGRIAQGRPALSHAAVTAFVDDLSGSAPLDIVSCTCASLFQQKVSDFVSIFSLSSQARHGPKL